MNTSFVRSGSVQVASSAHIPETCSQSAATFMLFPVACGIWYMAPSSINNGNHHDLKYRSPTLFLDIIQIKFNPTDLLQII